VSAPKPITEPVYLRFGVKEMHIGDVEVPAALTLSSPAGDAVMTVAEHELKTRMAALLRAAADRIDPKGDPDAAA
jgi:hypothetical protein